MHLDAPRIYKDFTREASGIYTGGIWDLYGRHLGSMRDCILGGIYLGYKRNNSGSHLGPFWEIPYGSRLGPRDKSHLGPLNYPIWAPYGTLMGVHTGELFRCSQSPTLQ